jgi:O-antigen/teichoic acid export membrane protein
MLSLSRNVVANFIGRAWSGLMAIAFVPIYIRYIGIESYGLVGIFAALQGITSVLDLGLSATVNRELARYSADPDRRGDMRDIARTLEWIYWGLAIAIGVVLLLAAGPLAQHWIKVNELSSSTVWEALVIMAVVVALQWPFAFYSGGLLGLQQQVAFNSILVFTATLRGVGTLVVLGVVSPTIQAFFLWQVLVSGFQTALAAGVLWRCLRMPGHIATFRRGQLTRVWRFSGGVAAISIVSLFLTQTDKAILSRLLSLDAFGYYALASLVAGSLYVFITPVFTTYTPVFAQLTAAGSGAQLARTYHRGCQLMSIAVLPAALVIAVFARDVLLLWTRNPATADRTHVLVVLLILGTALNGLMHLPYAVQLAHGWTRLTLTSNIVAAALLLPATLLAVNRYGAVGGASMWLLLNVGYVLITLPLMHRRVLRGEMREWFLSDVGLPLAAAAIVVLAARLLVREWRPEILLLALAATSACALLAAAVAAPAIRGWIVERLAGAQRVVRDWS